MTPHISPEPPGSTKNEAGDSSRHSPLFVFDTEFSTLTFTNTGNLAMPSTRITTGTWARGNEASIIEAVQNALRSSLEIPDYDRDVVLDLCEPSSRIIPSGRSDRYTRVEILLFAGRSLEAKRSLYKTLVANLSSVGVPANEVKTVLIEVPAENWGLRGGLPASEIDLGFKVDI